MVPPCGPSFPLHSLVGLRPEGRDSQGAAMPDDAAVLPRLARSDFDNLRRARWARPYAGRCGYGTTLMADDNGMKPGLELNLPWWFWALVIAVAIAYALET